MTTDYYSAMLKLPEVQSIAVRIGGARFGPRQGVKVFFKDGTKKEFLGDPETVYRSLLDWLN